MTLRSRVEKFGVVITAGVSLAVTAGKILSDSAPFIVFGLASVGGAVGRGIQWAFYAVLTMYLLPRVFNRIDTTSGPAMSVFSPSEVTRDRRSWIGQRPVLPFLTGDDRPPALPPPDSSRVEKALERQRLLTYPTVVPIMTVFLLLESSLSGLKTALATMGISMGYYSLFVLYAYRAQNDPVLQDTGYIRRLSSPLNHGNAIFESGELLSSPDQFRWGKRLVVALGGVIMLYVIVAVAIMFQTISLFSPIPELVSLIAVSYSVASSRLGLSSFGENNALNRIESGFEFVFFDVITSIRFAPIKGIVAFFIIVVGLVAGAMPYLTLVGILFAVGSSGGVTAVAELVTTLRGVTAVAFFVPFLVFGVYSLWYWHRVAKRLPAFLSWFGDPEVTHTTSSRLPIGGIFPATVPMLVSSLVFLSHGLFMHYHPQLEMLPLSLVVVSSLLMLGSVFVPLDSYRKTVSTPVSSIGPAAVKRVDNVHIPLQLVTLVGSIVFLYTAGAAYPALKSDGLRGLIEITIPGLIQPFLVALPVLLGMFYTRDVVDHARTSDRLNETTVLLTIVGISASVAAWQYIDFRAVEVMLLLTIIATVSYYLNWFIR